MKKLKEVRAILISVMVAVLALRVILWALQPFIPLIIEAVVIISVFVVVYALVVHRTTKL